MAYPLTAQADSKQALLFRESPITSDTNKTLSAILDQVNRKYGAGTIRYAVCGIIAKPP